MCLSCAGELDIWCIAAEKASPPIMPPKGLLLPDLCPSKNAPVSWKVSWEFGYAGRFLWISIETAVRFLLTPSTFCCILCAFFAKSGLKFPIIQAENITQKSSCIFRCKSFLELLPRFELGTSSLPRMRSTCWAIAANYMPLYKGHIAWRPRRDLNPRPPAWQAGVLTDWTTRPRLGYNTKQRRFCQ